ncbi:MAG: hypothetical protein ACNA8K_17575 [Cyclonatronaceae bacterium]
MHPEDEYLLFMHKEGGIQVLRYLLDSAVLETFSNDILLEHRESLIEKLTKPIEYKDAWGVSAYQHFNTVMQNRREIVKILTVVEASIIERFGDDCPIPISDDHKLSKKISRSRAPHPDYLINIAAEIYRRNRTQWEGEYYSPNKMGELIREELTRRFPAIRIPHRKTIIRWTVDAHSKNHIPSIKG